MFRHQARAQFETLVTWITYVPFGDMCDVHRTLLAKSGITDNQVLNLKPDQIQELLQRDLKTRYHRPRKRRPESLSAFRLD
jgi:hypothetical protein